MTREDLLQDIAYARTLAEEGRQAPLLGGAYLSFWGVLNTFAFTAHWAILTERAPTLDGAAFGVLWLGYGVVSIIGMILLQGRVAAKPGLASIGVRAERTVWSGAGLALSAIALGSIARMILTGDPDAPNAIFGAAFALYGAALYTTSKLAEQAWLTAYAWLSVLIAGALCVFANSDWAYLVAAIGSLLVLAWPGAVLMRREPSNLG